MDRDRYVQLMTDVTSRDPQRVSAANLELYGILVHGYKEDTTEQERAAWIEAADLALAEVGMGE